MDILYFGHSYEGGAATEKEFLDSISELFPLLKFKDAYSEIKGHRQQVQFNETKRDDYYAWILAHGWSGCSFNWQLMSLSVDKADEMNRLFEYSKHLYPENFKK